MRTWWKRIKKLLFKSKGTHRAFLIPGHKVVLVSIWGMNEPVIRAQCECGFYWSFKTPIPLQQINELMYHTINHKEYAQW